MIDINELRQSLGAVQPEEVAELLDRLEEVEKERDWHAERCEDAMNECATLRVKIEAMECMEKQEPSREWWDSLIADLSAIDCVYRGDPSYAHDAYWLRERVMQMFEQRSRDGNQWCALFGENIQDGVVGFGDGPDAAMWAFDEAWREKLPPAPIGVVERKIKPLRRSSAMTDITPRASAPSVFSFESTSVRTFADDHGEPWFCAADVCAVLGYRNPSDAVAKHCRTPGVAKREMGVVTGKKANGEDAVQQVEQAFINEGNLYRLIIKSRKPEAERFETWVMEEVLPPSARPGSTSPSPTPTTPAIPSRSTRPTLCASCSPTPPSSATPATANSRARS